MAKLNLGSGPRPKEGYLNADHVNQPGVDIVFDANEPFPFEDESFDEVYSEDFLPYIKPEKKAHVINEIWRILKIGGKMEHICARAGTENSYGPPGNISFWNLRTFEHFEHGNYRQAFETKYNPTKEFRKVVAENVNECIHIIYTKHVGTK